MQGDSTCCRKCVYEALERDFKDRDIRIDVRKEVDVTNLLKRAKDDLKRGNENECFKKLVTVIELLEEPLNGLLEA
jgi:shikimate kinase